MPHTDAIYIMVCTLPYLKQYIVIYMSSENRGAHMHISARRVARTVISKCYTATLLISKYTYAALLNRKERITSQTAHIPPVVPHISCVLIQ